MDRDTRAQNGAGETRVVTPDFVLLFISSFFFLGSLYLLIPVLPLYMKGVVGATTTQVGLLMGTITVSSLLLRPYIGRRADISGRKPLLILGTAGFVIASLLYIIARHIVSLAFVLAFYGIGVACFHTASLVFIGDIAPSLHRGKSQAWFQTSFNLAVMVAPPLGIFLKDRFGYDVVFIAAAIAAAISFLFILWVSESMVPDIGEPVGPPRAGHNRRLIAFVSVAVFAGTATLGAVETFLPLFAKSRGIGHFALFFTINAGLLIALRLLGGSIPDRLGRRWTITLGLLALGGSMFVLSASDSFAGLCIAAILFGVGFAFHSPALSALVMDHVPKEELGGAFGIYTAAFEAGIAFGAIAMGPVISWLGYGSAYLIIGCISLAGAIFVATAYRAMAG
jgi:MFS family permease